MTTTKVDLAMDKFVDIQELYQLSTEELDELNDRVDTRIHSLFLWAKETEADRELEMRSNAEEEPMEVEEE